jgi:hypothetical protein
LSPEEKINPKNVKLGDFGNKKYPNFWQYIFGKDLSIYPKLISEKHQFTLAIWQDAVGPQWYEP